MKSNKLKGIFLLFFLNYSLFSLSSFSSSSMAQVNREKFVDEALSHIGQSYVLGAQGPYSFDCSGLVVYSARVALNINLPRNSRSQYSYCRIIKGSEREVGDLLFFKTENSYDINHVGIYIGNNKFVSALSDGKNRGVSISDLNSRYWRDSYAATGRFLPSGKTTNEDAYKYNNEKDDLYNYEQKDNSYYWDDGSSYIPHNINENRQSCDNTKKENVIRENEEALNYTLDFGLFVDWTIFKPRIEGNPPLLYGDSGINYNGITAQGSINFPRVFLNPGFMMNLRYNKGCEVMQLGLLLNVTPNDILRLYMGPCITFGNAKLPNTDLEISNTHYHVMFGASISTPKIKIGNTGLQIVQDISYTDLSDDESFSLEYPKNIYAGLNFSTGLRVTIE